MMNFSTSDILQCALPKIIEDGRKRFLDGAVKHLQIEGPELIATVGLRPESRVALGREPSGTIWFNCSCSFAHGGACEHIIAAMYAANDPSRVTTNGSKIEIEERCPKPLFRLYLSESGGMLFVRTRFAYDNGLAEFERYDGSSRLFATERGPFVRIVRSKAREGFLPAELTANGLESYRSGVFTPRGDAREWLREGLPELVKKGFEVYGRENLGAYTTRDSEPKLTVSVRSSGDFFDCSVSVQFDEIPARLAALIEAVQARNKYVLLADGSTGLLPESWLNKLAALLSVGEVKENEEKIRLTTLHAGFIDELDELADKLEIEDTAKQLLSGVLEADTSQQVPPPANFKGTMRPYQSAGYEWFYFLQRCNSGGCLADDMGLGKTVQTLALLANEKKEGLKSPPSLVVVPASLLFNWQREARFFVPNLLVLVYHGPDRAKYQAKDFALADMVLTTYGTMLRDVDMLKKTRFRYVILDEAQQIKNVNSRARNAVGKLNSDFRLALSGTPIENNLSELWSLFSFLNPGLLGRFQSFLRNFAVPIEKNGGEQTAKMLHKVVSPFILRRTKKQVAPELPPKTETVHYAEMLPRQRKAYELLRDMYRIRIMNAIDEQGMERTRLQVLEGLLRLRQMCCHPVLVDPAFAGDSGKMRVLEDLIGDAAGGGHRILVFSQFVQMLNLISDKLASIGLVTDILTGKIKDRAKVVDRFQDSDEVDVLLISLKAGGVGLNLTAADYVVHVDPWWNPAAENQASDRAYRIGQTKPVFVYRLITKKSVEERVLELQEKKQELVGQIIKTEDSFFKKLDKGDILELLT